MDRFVCLFTLFTLFFSHQLFAEKRPEISLEEKKLSFLRLETPPDTHKFFYGSFGSVGPVIPKVAIGYRMQKGYIGHDVSLTDAFVPIKNGMNSLGLQYALLFYTKKSPLEQSSYIGIGAGNHLLYAQQSFIGSGSLACLIGMQFPTKEHTHFIEGKLGVPLIFYDLNSSDSGMSIYPIPSIAYGISF